MIGGFDSGGASGDGIVEIDSDPTPDPPTTDDTTTFDTSTQTLSTTTFGVADMDDDEPADIEVTTSDPDPSSSSPAGGAGAEEAVERFAGLPDGTLSGASTEEIVEVGQAASDAFTEQARSLLEADPQNMPADALRDALPGGNLPLIGAAIGAVALVAVALGSGGD